jgi:ribosomal protein S18 acetylase RimI-like enzyme
MEVTLRKARPDDAPQLARIHVAAWQKAYQGIVPGKTLAQFTVEARTERFRAFLAEGTAETCLAEHDNKAVGFITLGGCRDTDLENSKTGEIWGIYILPEYWRRGLGKSLCEQGQKLLALRGFITATLWVLEANDQARAFYGAMGFSPDGATKQLPFGIPVKAIRYRKPLS